MPTFKVHETFWSHPKVVPLSGDAIALWVRAGCYSTSHRLGGRIPLALETLIDMDAADELVAAGLWHEVDGGGWRFHEWRKHQDGDYRPNIPTQVRAAVLERDGHRCVFCHDTENLTMDHIIRYRDDGPDTVENLRTLCGDCNQKRG
jgi:hypothetical protein